MVFGTILSFTVGVYSGVYIAQNYELPNKDERKEIYQDLKTLWSEKLEERCPKRKMHQQQADASTDIVKKSDPGTSHANLSGAASSVTQTKSISQILAKYKKTPKNTLLPEENLLFR